MDSNAISEVTRRNLFDELRLGKMPLSGRLGESDFLARVFDLENLPSYDSRFPTMVGDIFMHESTSSIGTTIGFTATRGSTFSAVPTRRT